MFCLPFDENKKNQGIKTVLREFVRPRPVSGVEYWKLRRFSLTGLLRFFYSVEDGRVYAVLTEHGKEFIGAKKNMSEKQQ